RPFSCSYWKRENCAKPIFCSRCNDRSPLSICERTGLNDNGSRACFFYCNKGAIQLSDIGDTPWSKRHSGRCYGLLCSVVTILSVGPGGIPKILNDTALDAHVFGKFHQFATQIGKVVAEPGRVAPRMRKAFHQSHCDRITDTEKNDRNGRRLTLCLDRGTRSTRNEHARAPFQCLAHRLTGASVAPDHIENGVATLDQTCHAQALAKGLNKRLIIFIFG